MPRSRRSADTRSNEKKRVGRDVLGQLEVPNDVREQIEGLLSGAVGKPLDTGPDSPFVQAMGLLVEHMLEAEFDQHMGHARHERVEPSEEEPATRRENPRNGYSEKTLKTSLGQTRVAVPRDRKGTFEPQILPKNTSYTEDLAARIVAMYANGMTQRDIARHVRDLYGVSASDDFISDVVVRIEPELQHWRSRQLEPVYAIVYVDALHVKIRHGNGVRATACYIASGYGESGSHEVLGVWIAPSEHSDGHGESAGFWATALNELIARGLRDVLFIASDALTGLEEVIAAAFPKATHIPCVVHQVRSSLKQVPWKSKREVARALRAIYAAPTYGEAELALAQLEETWGDRYPRIIAQWEQLLPRLKVLWTYSKPLRKMIYTTNPQENMNRQVRKVTKNRGVLSTPDSALRLLTLALRNIDRKARETTRADWQAIVAELHLLFPDRLPSDWSIRLS